MPNALNLRGVSIYPTATNAWLGRMAEWERIAPGQSTKAYRYTLESFQSFHPGLRVNEVTEAHIDAYFVAHSHWSPNSCRAYRNRLASFFEWAITDDAGSVLFGQPGPLVLRDPTRAIASRTRAIWTSKRTVRTGNWLSLPQLRQLVESCSDSIAGRRDRVILLTAIYTGLRKSELASLRWGSIGWDDRTITVVGKGNKLAQVPLSDELYPALKLWHEQAVVDLDRAPSPTEAVFPVCYSEVPGSAERVAGRFVRGLQQPLRAVWAKPLSAMRLYKIVRERGDAIGVPTLATHDLRRSFTRALVEAKDEAGQRLYTVEDIRDLLRHSNISTTQTYLSDNRVEALSKGRTLSLGLGA